MKRDIDASYILPTVSVVILNYNYGSFISQAVASVMVQTYPFIECIVIDDCSTDNSRAMIDEVKHRYERVNVILNEENIGQCMCSREGYRVSTGAYIIFLDADDYMLPTCVEAHIATHLSLRTAVGLTSVDMLQIRDGYVITTAFHGFSEYVRAKKHANADLIRYLDLSDFISEPTFDEPGLRDAVYLVPPEEACGWPWSATSGNCFRRDALDLIINNDKLASLRVAIDCYLLRGVTSLTGSVLIDRPLVCYRLHATNDFQKSGNLHQIRSFNENVLADRSNKAMKILIDYFFDAAPELIDRVKSKSHYTNALNTLNGVYPSINTNGQSYVLDKILAKREALINVLGEHEYRQWLSTYLLPASIYWFPLLGSVLRYVCGSWAVLFVVWLRRSSKGK